MSPKDQTLIRKKVEKAIAPLKSIDVKEFSEVGYFNRSAEGNKLPPYYLVYFLFVELLSFKHLGRSEKVAWTIPVKYNNKIYIIEHRKMGLGVFCKNSEEESKNITEIVKLVRKGVKASQPFF